MIARRWRIAFSLGLMLSVLVYLVRFMRFYRTLFGIPFTLRNVLHANLAYIRSDWLNLAFLLAILIGMATNWALEKKRENRPQ
jgi:hypothetical protein